MNVVLTLIRLDQQAWWVDFKELLGLLGTLIAAISLTIDLVGLSGGGIHLSTQYQCPCAGCES